MANSHIERLLARYEGNRVVRGLLQLVPFGLGGATDVVLTKTLDNIREDRARHFFDELANRDDPLDPKVLESEDFLHCYFATTRYALNSRRREKIAMFARLLQASLAEVGPKDVDEYEEFLSVLEELSYREIRALAILDTFSTRPRTSEQNDLQWTNTFWDEFEQCLVAELGIPSDEVVDFMNRISRTGCYEMFTGGYFDYTGGKGKLTPTYRRLKGFVANSAGHAV
ncbi:MAG: hypothetical protein ACREVI_16580 [Steroidobacteraceae bacterium]